MHGFIGAVARLLVMGSVMAAVLVGALVAGLGTVTAVATGIIFAGTAGLFGVARRPRRLTPAQQIAAMLAADPLDGRKPAVASNAPGLAEVTGVDSMAPPEAAPVDPEVNMPRWRRPSLLEARRSDPTRAAPVQRIPMRFGEDQRGRVDVRVVRYAVVPVLDRPDEVLGLRLSDLGSGDEVQAVGSSGAFVEVVCPNGDRGFVHRTTLGQGGPTGIADGLRNMPHEADEALTALLSARGLI